MVTMSRRAFLGGASVAAAGTAVPRVAHAQPRVKIGTAVLGDYSMAGPIIVALEKGFFGQEGINAEFVPFRGGPDLLKAVLAGEVLIAVSGSTDVLVFREAGSPIKMIATHTEGNHFTLNVAPDVGALADLKGKAIGITRPGSTTWIFARMLAKQQGWDPDRDVKIVALGALDAQLAALARKEIAAFIWGDGGAVTELQGKSKILMRLDRFTPQWISQVDYASEDAIRKEAETIKKGLRGIFRGLRFMKEHPEDAAPLAAKRLGWTPEAVLRAHKVSSPLFPFDGSISVQALTSIQDVLLEYGIIKKRLPIDEHFTKDFVPVKLV
ncbi:MAG TPA: ABC transporter substrate-binding protein [Candidatus Acidoferrum sp.]|nr:ABC transporter substrate-binding protein [Candidatus Acidoferrum sp.]